MFTVQCTPCACIYGEYVLELINVYKPRDVKAVRKYDAGKCRNNAQKYWTHVVHRKIQSLKLLRIHHETGFRSLKLCKTHHETWLRSMKLKKTHHKTGVGSLKLYKTHIETEFMSLQHNQHIMKPDLRVWNFIKYIIKPGLRVLNFKITHHKNLFGSQ